MQMGKLQKNEQKDGLRYNLNQPQVTFSCLKWLFSILLIFTTYFFYWTNTSAKITSYMGQILSHTGQFFFGVLSIN